MPTPPSAPFFILGQGLAYPGLTVLEAEFLIISPPPSAEMITTHHHDRLGLLWCQALGLCAHFVHTAY